MTTAMLHLAAHLLSTTPALLLERPRDTLSMAGRVFWIAVAAEIAARTTSAIRPTVPEILARAAVRDGPGVSGWRASARVGVA